MSPMEMRNVPPRIPLNIPPGTQLQATSGPPCPGAPGWFLCPNKFSCAPAGGVCCPGAGHCNPGFFCDKFVNQACIGPSNARFCPGSQNQRAGEGLHCAPGKRCVGGPRCT
jgi:hypothetical protein